MPGEIVIQGLKSLRLVSEGYGVATAGGNNSNVITQGMGIPNTLVTQAYKSSIPVPAAGGVRHGGAIAVPALVSGRAASGGMRRGGAATVLASIRPVASGGISRGGVVSQVAGTNTMFPAGGMRRGGAATSAWSSTSRAAGGISRGGTVIFGGQIPAFATGGMRRGGSASPSGAQTVFATGGMRRGGVVSIGRNIIVPLNGGMRLGGRVLAPVQFNPVHLGGIDRGGEVSVVQSMPEDASGGMQHGAENILGVARGSATSGGFRLSGVVRPGVAVTRVAGGGFRLGGFAPPSKKFPYVPTISVSHGGEVAAVVAFSPAASGGVPIGGLSPRELRAHISASPIPMRLGGSASPGAGVAPTFRAALVKMLRSNTLLVQAIGGQRIYSKAPGRRTPLPYVLIEDYVEGQPGETIETNQFSVMFVVRAFDNPTVLAVGEALKKATDTQAQDNQSFRDPLVWSEGKEECSWRKPTQPPVRLPQTDFGVDVYEWRLQYEWECYVFFQE